MAVLIACRSKSINPPKPAQRPAGASDWDTMEAIIPAASLVKQNETV